jgi:hypothetical protein
MYRSIIILIYLLFAGSLHGQSLKKYAIGKSGCSAYFFCDPGTFNLDKSEDSSDVYTGECIAAEMTYGIICVKLKEKMTDMQTGEDVLISYLDYLKKSLNVITAAGYGKGHRLKNNEDTRGVMDYWTDKDSLKWKIKGWTDGKYIAVLYVSNKNDIPEAKANAFLDGLVLPAK